MASSSSTGWGARAPTTVTSPVFPTWNCTYIRWTPLISRPSQIFLLNVLLTCLLTFSVMQFLRSSLVESSSQPGNPGTSSTTVKGTASTELVELVFSLSEEQETITSIPNNKGSSKRYLAFASDFEF